MLLDQWIKYRSHGWLLFNPGIGYHERIEIGEEFYPFVDKRRLVIRGKGGMKQSRVKRRYLFA